MARLRDAMRISARVHPVVRLAYTVRASTYPLFGILLCMQLYSSGRLGPMTLAAVLLYLGVWPRVAYEVARRSRNTKQAELINLSIDSFIIGAWLPFLNFAFWPSVVIVLGVHAGNLSIGGLRFALFNLLLVPLGVVSALPIAGLRFEPISGMLPTLGSIAVLFVYISVYGLHSHIQSKRVVHAMKQISQQKADLEASQARLEAQTSELVRANTAAAQAQQTAEQANRAKSRFLANMSHELRTPLNAIIGYSEMLMEEAADLGASGITPDLEKIRGAGKHLLGLINEVLDLSKIEAGKMELELDDFAVAPLVEEVAATVRPIIAQNRNALDLALAPDLGTMRGDATKLRQILLNLLGNAAKFTEDGRIVLGVRREQGEQVRLVFSVKDSGIGMSADQIGRLFQPFTQADASTTRKYGGTGLGLTISRRFSQLMGGDITVESRPGEGTTFTVVLPEVVKEAAPKPVTGDLVIADLKRYLAEQRNGASTVLVIDDDADARELLERLLTKDGHRVVQAGGGEEGLALARELRPNLITLDVLMPQQDGWSVLSALRAEPELADIPVLVLSVVDHAAAGKALGAAAHMRKPVDRDAFVGEVRRLLKKA
ncbi:MAG: ATP-binding protein [Gemmatimonadota bacterium]|nr:ATP-binding protein [Gemmatimonadota bacterium]